MRSFAISNRVCYKLPSLFKPGSKRNLTARLVWWLASASGWPMITGRDQSAKGAHRSWVTARHFIGRRGNQLPEKAAMQDTEVADRL